MYLIHKLVANLNFFRRQILLMLKNLSATERRVIFVNLSLTTL